MDSGNLIEYKGFKYRVESKLVSIIISVMLLELCFDIVKLDVNMFDIGYLLIMYAIFLNQYQGKQSFLTFQISEPTFMPMGITTLMQFNYSIIISIFMSFVLYQGIIVIGLIFLIYLGIINSLIYKAYKKVVKDKHK